MTHHYRELCPPEKGPQLKGGVLPHKDQPCGVFLWVLNFHNDVDSKAYWGLNEKRHWSTGIMGHRRMVTNRWLARDGQIRANQEELVALHGSQGTHTLTGLIWVMLTGCHRGRGPSPAAAHSVALRKPLSLFASFLLR